MSWDDLVAQDSQLILLCPACAGGQFAISNDVLVCGHCDAKFPVDRERQIIGLVYDAALSKTKQDIKSWWGDLYQQWYGSLDRTLTRERLAVMLSDTEALFRLRGHLATTEMPRELAGKRILEIGSGGGAHSALFKSYGASVVAVDITPQRAASTALKLSLVEKGEGRVYQADAENLPFRDGSFDIIYSNGVLHHSENPAKAIAEAYRVLKPSGHAVVMLYARHSALFWWNIVPRAIVSTDIFRYPEARWIGHATEGRPKHGGARNPITHCYSARELRRLLANFHIISLRKNSFAFSHVPIPRAWKLRAMILKAMGYQPHLGAPLLYGDAPYYPETGLEQWLSPYLGFGWNILLQKPA